MPSKINRTDRVSRRDPNSGSVPECEAWRKRNGFIEAPLTKGVKRPHVMRRRRNSGEIATTLVFSTTKTDAETKAATKASERREMYDKQEASRQALSGREMVALAGKDGTRHVATRKVTKRTYAQILQELVDAGTITPETRAQRLSERS